MKLSEDFNFGFTRSAEDGPVVMNLSQKNWVLGAGLGLDEAGDWRLPTATGSETMFAHHMVAELRKKLEKMTTDEGFASKLADSASAHGEMVILLPQDARLRQEVFAMASELFRRAADVNLRNFTSMKIYMAPTADSRNRFCVRKFKGRTSNQVVVNLCEQAFRFFRFHGRDHEDVDIDTMVNGRWEDDPEAAARQVEAEVRMFDMNYFRRIREAAEDGTIYLLMPMGPKRRELVLKAFLKILQQVPGGAIDLSDARLRRIYPGAMRAG